MAGHPYAAAIPRWISHERFEPYLRHAGSDPDKACELYEWAAELTSASFEVIHYVEVLLRNAIDSQMRLHPNETGTATPWLRTPLGCNKKTQDAIDRDVQIVRARLRKLDPQKDTHAQIVAGLMFGFWANMLGPSHDNLWRTTIRKAFPYFSGRRSDVAVVVTELRKFRNRLAHHDSLLVVDVPFFITQMIKVAGWIDPAAATWLAATERATGIHARRPAARRDTVVVAGTYAWPLYNRVHAYICQAGRAFQPVEHVAFYADRAIQPEIAVIQERIDNLDWTEAESRRLHAAGDSRDKRIAAIMDQSRADGWDQGRYQLFLLSAPGEPGHYTRKAPIPHTPATGGRGQAFTQGQRYAVKQRMITAASTNDLG